MDIIENARVTSIDAPATGTRVHSSAGTVHADTAVIAAGIWSKEICRPLGLDLNLFPGKGYSFTVPVQDPPRQLIHLDDAHVALSPLAKNLRIAGTMEFDHDHDRFCAQRIKAIIAAARPYLTGIDWDARRDEWVGPHPMTPDGLPAIGALLTHHHIYLATGHNMLGFMLAPATGRACRGPGQ